MFDPLDATLTRQLQPLGGWKGNPDDLEFEADRIHRRVSATDSPFLVIRHQGRLGVAPLGPWGSMNIGDPEVLALVPAFAPSAFGSREFQSTYGVRLPYMAGGMAKGIAGEDLVIALGKSGLLGTFGTGALSLARIESAIENIQRVLGEGPYAFNLIHSPKEPEKESRTVDLYLKYGVRTIEASSFVSLSPNIVRYRAAGLSRGPGGQTVIGHRVIAKLSRRELAAQFLTPAPASLLERMVADGSLSPLQADLARTVPMADDITVEADSAGHTDNRPLISLLPSMLQLRDEYARLVPGGPRVRVGAAGGISTPPSVLAAFMMGADYVVTGSLNQSSVEAATSAAVKNLLASASMTDLAMAPESDMFEGGFRVQVLKKGTMYPMRAQKLLDLYQRFESLEDLPATERQRLESQVFQRPLDVVWNETSAYWSRRDPSVLVGLDAKAKMSLVFRSYLSQSSRWAIEGDPARAMDYQIWCGPGMGAFNDWVRSTPLADWKNRGVVTVADYLLQGAADLYRERLMEGMGVRAGTLGWEVQT